MRFSVRMTKTYQHNDHQEHTDAILNSLAGSRFGCFSREQALARGITDNELQHRRATGRLVSVYRGVYRMAGSTPSWNQRLMAASLAQKHQGVVSHRSAAKLERLIGAQERPLELIVPRSVNRARRSGLLLHTGLLSPADVITIGPFRVTHPARTLFDLATVVDADMLEEALDDAIARAVVTLPRLRWQLGQLATSGRDGICVMRRFLGARKGRGSDSPLETRLLRLIRDGGLPQPVQQYPISSDGRIVARVDLAYPRERIAIEADGGRFHKRPRTWQRDLAKMNALTKLSWRFLRFTWEDVHERPHEVLGTISSLLGV